MDSHEFWGTLKKVDRKKTTWIIKINWWKRKVFAAKREKNEGARKLTLRFEKIASTKFKFNGKFEVRIHESKELQGLDRQ